MNDRELLELAAKAAGPENEFWFRDQFGMVYFADEDWNPLTDDGDALRLAVKLRITVEQCLFETKVSAYVRSGYERQHFTSVSGNVTREQATRDAIVHTSAAIGEAMP